MQLACWALPMLAMPLIVVYIDALHAIGISDCITIPHNFQNNRGNADPTLRFRAPDRSEAKVWAHALSFQCLVQGVKTYSESEVMLALPFLQAVVV